MNILFFYQYFGTPKGSWSTRVYELTRRWVNAGHEVTVVTAPYDKSDIKKKGFISRQEIEGIQLIVINSGDSNRFSKAKRVYRAVVFALVSIYYALTSKYDTLVASSGPITIGLPLIAAKKIRNKRTVFEVRDLWPTGGIEMGLIRSKWQQRTALWFEKLCYKCADLIVPCSKGMETGILQVASQKPTLVIPNASDPSLFPSTPIIPNKFPKELNGKKIFLYAGSLGLMDDCGQIVRAMFLIKDPSIALVFAGDGTERGELELLAQESGNSNIYFLGLLPKTEVVKWFSIAVATLVTFKDYPVLQTNSPNKMFDSFAAGVPVIQSTSGWIKELIDKENCGITVGNSNPREMADAILLIASDSQLRHLMAKNAKRLADTEFNRDILANKYIEGLMNISRLKIEGEY